MARWGSADMVRRQVASKAQYIGLKSMRHAIPWNSVQRFTCRGDATRCGCRSHLIAFNGAHDPAPVRCPVKRVAGGLGAFVLGSGGSPHMKFSIPNGFYIFRNLEVSLQPSSRVAER